MSAPRFRTIGASLGAAALVTSLLLTGSASAETPDRDEQSLSSFTLQSVTYSHNNTADPRFTQLLGVNDKGVIAGYHGDENTENTPNKGFTLKLSGQIPDAKLKFTDENFPGSDQTQVIGINNDGDTVGFYVTGNVTHGFMKEENKDAVSVDLPGTGFNQLLGVNNKGQSAGYYQDAAGNQHGYIREKDGSFLVLNIPMPSDQAASINDRGDVVGFMQSSPAATTSDGFLLHDGQLTKLDFPGSTFTQALGINNSDVVVGTYNDSTTGAAHGFKYQDGHYETIDFADGGTIVTGTVVNGINNHGKIVGFYSKSVPIIGTMTSEVDTRGFIGQPDK